MHPKLEALRALPYPPKGYTLAQAQVVVDALSDLGVTLGDHSITYSPTAGLEVKTPPIEGKTFSFTVYSDKPCMVCCSQPDPDPKNRIKLLGWEAWQIYGMMTKAIVVEHIRELTKTPAVG